MDSGVESRGQRISSKVSGLARLVEELQYIDKLSSLVAEVKIRETGPK